MIGHRGREHGTPPGRCMGAAQRPPGQERDGDGAQHQEDVYGLSPGIEEQAKDQQHGVVPTARAEKVSGQHCRQKDKEKGNAGKDHGPLSLDQLLGGGVIVGNAERHQIAPANEHSVVELCHFLGHIIHIRLLLAVYALF